MYEEEIIKKSKMSQYRHSVGGVREYNPNRPSREYNSRTSGDYGSHRNSGDYSRTTDDSKRSSGDYTKYRVSGDYGNHTRPSPTREYSGASVRSSLSGDFPYSRRSQSPYSSSSRDSISPSKIEDPTTKFEKGRIAMLQQERVNIQKKTFTKWCNSFLEKVSSSGAVYLTALN